MNTAYNNTSIQESRNRYNALLTQALANINRRKTDKTAQPETTTEEAPAMDMYHGYLDDKTTLQAGRIRATLEKSVRLDSNGPVLTWLEHIERLWRAGGLWGYKHLEVSTDYTSTDTKYIARTHWRISTPQSRAEYDGYYVANKTVVEYVKHLLALSGEDVTAGDPTESETLRHDARLLYLDICKSNTCDKALVSKCVDKLVTYYTLEGGKSKREVAEAICNDLRPKLCKIEDFGARMEVRRYLADLVKQAREDEPATTEELATTTTEEVTTQEQPAPVATPEATTATEEAPPATAPQQPEEETTAPEATPVQEPEDVTTEEGPELAVEQEDDNAPVLRDLIEQYGNVGADYLDTLDYTQAEACEYRSVKGGVSKPEQKYYTTEDGTMYGLFRRYNRNGKRARFAVYQDGRMIEARTYGKNNSCYKAEIQYNGGNIVYNVTDGVITGGTYTTGDKLIIVRFDDTNRPETPRDLPAPAPTKPTSKTATAPTTEEVTTPEEVQEVTTSKQEDGPAPYWLLLDNELRVQQEEQEQETAPAPEATKQEEPMHAPQMLKKIIEEQKRRASEGTNTIPLKTAVGMTTEVLTKKRAKELLGDDYSDYNTYILVEGTHIVETGRPTLKNTLYIDDESKEYKEYQRGNVSKVELYRNDVMSMCGSERGIKAVEDNPAILTVDETKEKVLSFNLYRRAGYGYRKANPDEVEIYKAAMRANHEAFSKRLDSYLRRYGNKIHVSAYWANR